MVHNLILTFCKLVEKKSCHEIFKVNFIVFGKSHKVAHTNTNALRYAVHRYKYRGYYSGALMVQYVSYSMYDERIDNLKGHPKATFFSFFCKNFVG